MQYTLALDLKTGTLSLVSSREALTSLTLRRGGRYGLRLFVTEHGSPVDLPAGYTVESSAKQSADASNALIFSPWSGTSPVECTVHAAGDVLDGLLSVDGDPSNDVESVDLLFDVLVLDGSGEVVAQSQRVTLTVENTVTRGGESGPELAPLSARLIESLPAITGLVGGEPEHLDARATAALPIGWRVLVKDGGLLRVFELKEDDGAGIPEDAVLPVDHDAEDNAKVWLPAMFAGVTAEDLTAALAGKADASALSAHTGNTSNPHNVTAAQVGLGSVPNFGVASQAEAEAGASADKLMTPERTAQAIAALAAGGGGGSGLVVDVQVFHTPGNHTWTKPAGAVSCEYVAIGGGGGGGSGRHATDGNHRGGGGGGGGGGIVRELIMADELAATESITVGTGGTGGAAITANDTNGANGIAGTASTIAGRTASGGNGGGGGVSGTGGTSGSAISNGSFIHSTAFTTGVGGGGGANGAGFSPTPVAQRGPTGGGGGGGYSSSDTGGTGAAGGSQGTVPVGVKQGGSGSNPINPIVGGNGSGTRGGGGGAGTVNGGGHGGNGGVGGGGGGGGGAPNTATSSGKGGDGGNGLVIVTTYCTL